MMNQQHRITVLVVALLSATTVSALAVDSAGSGFWDEGATWVGSVVPSGADDVTITNGCSHWGQSPHQDF